MDNSRIQPNPENTPAGDHFTITARKEQDSDGPNLNSDQGTWGYNLSLPGEREASNFRMGEQKIGSQAIFSSETPLTGEEQPTPAMGEIFSMEPTLTPQSKSATSNQENVGAPNSDTVVRMMRGDSLSQKAISDIDNATRELAADGDIAEFTRRVDEKRKALVEEFTEGKAA